MGIIGNSGCQIHNEGCVIIHIKQIIMAVAVLPHLPACCKYILFTAIHNLVRTGIILIRMLYHIILEQIIFQIGIRQIRIIQFQNIPGLLISCVPAVTLRVCIQRFIFHVAVLPHMLFQTGHQIVSCLIMNLRPPSKVIQSKIPHIHLFSGFQTQYSRHVIFQFNRHIADIDNFGIGAQPSGRFSHNRRRVRVVQHPGIRRIFLHIVQILQNSTNRTHAVSDTARATGFLSNHIVFQRNLLIQLAHSVFSYTNLRHGKVDICIRLLRIGGCQEFNIRCFRVDNNFTCSGNYFLALRIIVIKLDFP